MTASPSVAPTRHIILFLLILASLVHPSVGSAAVPTYTGEHFDGCGGPRGGGQRDNAGNLYLPCARTATTNTPTIRVYNAAGTLVSATASPQLPGGSAYLSDVAPSPDGSYLYVAQNDTKSYYRLVRQGNGSYAYDASFHFAQYQYGPTLKDPHGEFLTTDASGNIYISNGTWVAAWLAAPMTVLRYDASGRFLGRFGEDSSKSRKLGEFYWMITDLAVTPDGMHVYTTEVGNNRVQRWDRQFDGSFVATTIYGNTAADDGIDNPATAGDESRQTNCATGHFGAPYASALDTAGNLYVVNTNCWAGGTTQVQRLDRATGTWATITGPKYGDDQAHEIAIDGAGSIYVASVNTLLRAGSAPIAVTDVTAPVFNGAALPAATDTRTVTLALSATDNFGVTQVRVATDNADITSGTWQNFGAQLAVELSAGDGPKTVRVQVRDAAGNLSAVLVATTIYTAPAVAQPGAPVPAVAAPAVGENAAPVLKSVALPNPATTQTVTVTTVAIDDAKVTGMRLATEEGTWSDWRDYAATTPFALTAGTGFRGVSVQVRDAQGLVSNPVYTITTAAAPGIGVAADVTAPTLTASLNALTETRTTTLRLIATDAVAVTQVRTAVEGVDIESAAWRDYAPTQTVLLPEGNGIKWVSVQVRDAAGNVATAAAKIELVVPVAAPAGGVAVNTAPVLGSLTLPATSPTSTITVQLGASDDRLVTKMRFATEDGNWRAWQDFTATSVFVLTPGAGPRGVFAQVQDADGLVSTVLYRMLSVVAAAPDAAPLPVQQPLPIVAPPVAAGEPDALAPVLRPLRLPAVIASRSVDLTVDATDNVGVTKVRIANEDGNWSAWLDYAAAKSWTLTPFAMTKGVFMQVRDAAGNESNVQFQTTLCTPCLLTPRVLAALKHKPQVTIMRARRGTLRADRIMPSARAQHFDLSQLDHRRDVLDCGAGRDTALVRPEDVTRHCEHVVVVHDPKV